MTGNDDGGFSPHPGDPWHPGWDPDAESNDEPLSSSEAPELEEQPTKKRRRRFGRRARDEDSTDSAEPIEEVDSVASTPDQQSETTEDAEPEVEVGDRDDPFDAVLRAEGRSVRRRPDEADDAPVPDWTADQEIPDELHLPVAPPSWIGDTTATDPAIEASGFEPVAMPVEPVEQPDLFAPVDDEPEQEIEVEEEIVAEDGVAGSEALDPATDTAADEVEIDEGAIDSGAVEVAEESIGLGAVADATEDEIDAVEAIVGEYGVAGPEAFDALAGPADEDLGDWEAFMEGAATPAEPEASHPDALELAAPAEPLADGDAFDEWIESEPRQKRRWFGRRRKDPVVEEVVDIEWVDDATVDEAAFMPPESTDPAPVVAEDPDTAVAEALAALGAADADVEPLAAPVEDTVVWSADDGEVAWADEIVGGVETEPEIEPTDAVEDASPAVEETFVAQDPVLEDDVPPDADDVVEPTPAVMGEPVETGPDLDPETTESELVPALDQSTDTDEFEDSHEVEDSDQPFFLGELPEEDGEPRAEEPVDWEGDGSRVPSAWFADVDEDTVVPPVAADTPETEWQAEEGPWEGRAAWDAQESKEVFDVEADSAAAEPSVELPPAEPVGPVIPEGYEQWGQAVADATSDAGEETAEYHVQHIPAPAQELPEGFEPFPGSETDVAYGDGSAYSEDQRMPSDDTFEEAPVAYVDDVEGEEPEFDEQIYVGGGTVEHRGLAEAIAAVGEDDGTEWQAMSAAMPGVETGVLGFEDVADLANGDDYVAPVRSNLGMRVLTGIVLMAMLIGSMFVGGWAFALFVGAIVLLGLGELYATLSRQGYLPLTLFGLVGAAGTLLATWFHGPVAIPAGVMLTGIAVFFFYAFAPTRRDALTNGGVTLLGLAWAVGAIAFAIPIARGADFEVLVLAVVVTTAAMDIGAYTVGRRFGRRPMAPVLSPNKTVEGLIGGAFLALAVAGAFGFFAVEPFDLRAGLALGAIVVVMAPLGDLAESMIKRSMGVKDMGSTLPGHGGVLDRIDALVFVIPGAWVLFEVLGYLG